MSIDNAGFRSIVKASLNPSVMLAEAEAVRSRILVLASLVLVTSSSARADEEEDLFKSDASQSRNAGVPDASAFSAATDDYDIPAYQAPVKVEPKATEAPKGPSNRLPLDLSGKLPLADNWGPTVVAMDVDSVVVELPVLYAQAGQGFDGTTYWLVAEVFSNGVKVSESRALVSRDTVAPRGPSVQFFRLSAPVAAPSGVLEVKVSKLGAAAGAKPSLLISRSVSYQLPG